MPTLPTPGGDLDSWGTELNQFLEVSHAADGSLYVTNNGAVIINPATSTGAGNVPGLKISVGDGSPTNPAADGFVSLYAHIQTSADRLAVWAANTIAEVPTGLDGGAYGLEVNVNNDGSDVVAPGITNHKLGIEVVSGNHAYPGSAAYSVNTARTGGDGWHHGLFIRGVGDSAITITDNSSGGTLMPTIGVSIGNPTAGMPGPIVSRQFVNGEDNILLQRVTDSTPTGSFLRCINTANSQTIFNLDVSGLVQTIGTIIVGGDLLVQPSGTDVFRVLASGAIRTNQVAASAVPATQNKRIPVYNTSSGTLEGYIPLYNT